MTYDEGVRHGRWARANIAAQLDQRGGEPTSGDVLRYGPDWARGYVAGGGLDAELERQALEQADAPAGPPEDCPACDGAGYLIEEANEPDEGYRVWQVGCPECAGNGWVVREPCIACGAPVTVGQPVDEQDHDEGCPVQGEEVRR